MNDLEDRLRDAYRAVAELVQEDAVSSEAPTRRVGSKRRAASASGARIWSARRAWGIAPVATAAIVAAIAVTVGVIVPHVLSGQHARGRAHPRHAVLARPRAHSGLPEFAVASSDTGLEVIQTTTGRIIGQISAPSGQAFSQVAGDGSDRTFYVSAQQANYQASCRAYFYRFSLSTGGQASALTPLPGSGQEGLPTALAASADGRKLAFSVVHCANGAATRIPLSRPIGYIAVLDMATGKTTGRWTYSLGEDYPTGMSLTSNGNLLAFAQYSSNGSAIVAKALRTNVRSGTVDRASRVVGLRDVSSLSVGTALYGCISTDRSGGRVANQLGAYDLTTGHLTAVLGTWTGLNTGCSLATNVVHGHLLAVITTMTLPKQQRSWRSLKASGKWRTTASNSSSRSVGVVQGTVIFTVRMLAIDVRTGQVTRLMTINASSASTIIGW